MKKNQVFSKHWEVNLKGAKGALTNRRKASDRGYRLIDITPSHIELDVTKVGGGNYQPGLYLIPWDDVDNLYLPPQGKSAAKESS